ncbi:MAG: DNA-directed RNA polymerase subunit omega [Deltaproteobacteria bacterium]|nr:DNA-directed RNA polymerase subunit omega [Deltaproteobacteria bacterium]
MARITIEDCLEKVENRFVLVHGAIQRALQLKRGAPSLVDAPGEKETVIALREIAQGKVKIVKKNSGKQPTPSEGP